MVVLGVHQIAIIGFSRCGIDVYMKVRDILQ
jgi:hypothetical protein